MEKLERDNSWAPSAADQTPPGSETLVAYRTRLGIVTGYAKVHGTPVAYTQLRSTCYHEVDYAGGFEAFNDPNAMRSPQDFQRAAFFFSSRRRHTKLTCDWSSDVCSSD